MDSGKEYYGSVSGLINTSHPGSYVVRALSTPCTVTIPVINGMKYLVTTSSTYISSSVALGEVDFGPAVGIIPLNSAATYGTSTSANGIHFTSRSVYTATSTGTVTFQAVIGSASAATIRTDNPMITAKRVY